MQAVIRLEMRAACRATEGGVHARTEATYPAKGGLVFPTCNSPSCNHHIFPEIRSASLDSGGLQNHNRRLMLNGQKRNVKAARMPTAAVAARLGGVPVAGRVRLLRAAGDNRPQ
jgi:hypothetical protein